MLLLKCSGTFLLLTGNDFQAKGLAFACSKAVVTRTAEGQISESSLMASADFVVSVTEARDLRAESKWAYISSSHDSLLSGMIRMDGKDRLEELADMVFEWERLSRSVEPSSYIFS